MPFRTPGAATWLDDAETFSIFLHDDAIPHLHLTGAPHGAFKSNEGDGEAEGTRHGKHLDGSDDSDKLTGGEGDDDLEGGGGGDRLSGGGGDDAMHGGSGNDVMDGGIGDDDLDGGIGSDHASGGSGNDTLEGGTGNDTLEGDSGVDRLDGGSGADVMQGGSGNDVYVVDNAADRVVELTSSGSGTDTEQSSISRRLSSGVERLTLTGTGSIDGTGNSQANTIAGNSGNNRIDGGAGSDTLSGGAGRDTFVFASDTLHADRVTDFATGRDHVQLNHTAFAALGAAGDMNDRYFHEGSTATKSTDHLLYNQASGALYYDDDGKGGHAAHLIGSFGAGTDLNAGDFWIG